MQHDSGYHLLFSHPALVEDLFRSFVTEPWVEQLDFTTLERVNAKLHTEWLERREGDLIYRVLLRDGSEVYLYLLLEFQSQPDPWMALRVLVYTGLLYQHLVREHRLAPNSKLPPVFPLVLYNGDARWNAAQDMKELINLRAGTPLWSYQPTIRYYLIDESRYPEGKPGSLVGVLFQIENCRSLDELKPVIKQLADQWQDQIPPSLRRAFVSWIYRVVAPGRSVELTSSNFEDFSEVQVMLATRMQQWEQELIEKGVERGVEKGIERGMVIGEAEFLRRQLNRRFGALPAWVDARLEAADRDALEQWGIRVLDATTLEAVFA